MSTIASPLPSPSCPSLPTWIIRGSNVTIELVCVARDTWAPEGLLGGEGTLALNKYDEIYDIP